jgi:hypothetical protein
VIAGTHGSVPILVGAFTHRSRPAEPFRRGKRLNTTVAGNRPPAAEDYSQCHPGSDDKPVRVLETKTGGMALTGGRPPRPRISIYRE